jgi:CRISPR-associated endonuclease Csn1
MEEKIILGLDPGANSIGWALLRVTENANTVALPDVDDVNEDDLPPLYVDEESQLLDAGVVVFEAGVEGLGQGDDKEQSRSVARRQARGLRRRYFRRRLRRRKLLAWFRQTGLMTDQHRPADFNAYDPYTLRARALTERLPPFELAVAFYHLNQRRGFLSNRKTDDPKESGALYKGGENGTIGIEQTRAAIQEHGFRTLGEFLHSLSPDHEERKRARYLLRAMIKEEFDLVWAKQREYYPDLLTDEAFKKVRDEFVFFQRPLRSAKHLVGACTLVPNRKRCAASHPLAQEYIVRQTVNHLKIEVERPLEDQDYFTGLASTAKRKAKATTPVQGTGILEPWDWLPEEREALVRYLLDHEKLDLNDLHKALPELQGRNYRTNFDRWSFGEKKKAKKEAGTEAEEIQKPVAQRLGSLPGSSTGNGFRLALGDNWRSRFTEEQILEIWHLLYSVSEREPIVKKLTSHYGLTEDEADKLAGNPDKKIPGIRFKDGYVNLSLKAIRAILPGLKAGKRYDEAVTEVFGDHRRAEPDGSLPALPRIHPKDLPDDPQLTELRNPVVKTALQQLHKLVNQIIARHGKPHTIRLELGRDLAGNRKERKEAEDRIRQNEEINNEVKQKLQQVFANHAITKNPSRNDVERYKLWEECDHTCPYTGKPISVHQLFNGEVDVEHIIPWSRCFDNSYANKTLCFRTENERKGNRTPYEAYHGTAQYDQILERVQGCQLRKKLHKFRLKDLKSLDDFASQQLNDTRYAARLMQRYLKYICTDVTVSKGQVTAHLRQAWGLGGSVDTQTGEVVELMENEHLKDVAVVGKNRLDHRHHAVDAIVVALTTRSILQRLATSRGRSKRTYEKHHITLPFPSLVPQAREILERLVVVHQVRRKVQGRLHEETFYGRLYKPDRTPVTDDDRPLSSLQNQSDVQKLVHCEVKTAVVNRLVQCGILPTEAAQAFLRGEPSALTGKKKVVFQIPPNLLAGLKHPTYGTPIHIVSFGQTLYAVRKPLLGLTDENAVRKIVDPEVKAAVLKRLVEKNVISSNDARLLSQGAEGETGKIKFKIPKNALADLRHPANGTRIRTVRLQTVGNNFKQVRPGVFVAPDTNHHAAFFELLPDTSVPVKSPTKEAKIERTVEVVSLWNAYERKARQEPVVNTAAIPNARFLFALHKNDLFLKVDLLREWVETLNPESKHTKRLIQHLGEAFWHRLRQATTPQLTQPGFWKDFPWHHKPAYRLLWKFIYRVETIPQSEQVVIRHHTIAKAGKVRLVTGQEDFVGKRTFKPNTMNGLKLKIDPTGFLSVAEE